VGAEREGALGGHVLPAQPDQPPASGGPFDVIFLRNVLIYFDLETKREVLRRVRSAIRPKAFLLLGAAETTWGLDDAWERVPVERGSTYQLSSRRAA
jgi:chemotaxis protein methyltransferase CheR